MQKQTEDADDEAGDDEGQRIRHMDAPGGQGDHERVSISQKNCVTFNAAWSIAPRLLGFAWNRIGDDQDINATHEADQVIDDGAL